MDLSMKTTPSHSSQPTIESLQVQVEELTAKVRWYEEQFRLSQQKRFGTSSEKTPNNQLYLIERKLKHVKPTERYKQRVERSRPILDLFQHGFMNRKIVFYQKVH
ncbi:hypothetical protein BAQ46_20760 [Bacillus paranthracis]|nr:hypothetical protein BAQ46_20760 [Bacillus paranthracis]